MEDYKNETANAEDYRRDVPYSVYRDMAIRYENTVKKFIAAMVIIVIIFSAWSAWREWSWQRIFDSYDITTETISIENEDDGNANYLEAGMNGAINNGE